MEMASDTLLEQDYSSAPQLDEPSPAEVSLIQVDWFWLAIAGVAPLLALSPLLLVQAFRVWDLAHYRFAPLAILAAISLTVIHFRPAAPDRKRFLLAVIAVISGCFLSLLAVGFFLPTLAHVAIVVILFGWLVGQMGETRISRILSIVLIAAVTIPLPYGWDYDLMRSCQNVAADWTSGSLDAIGVLHLPQPGVLLSRFFLLPISRIAGGPDSIFFLFGFAAVLISARRHGWIASIVLLMSVPLWIILYSTLSQTILGCIGNAWESPESPLPFLLVRVLTFPTILLSMLLFDVSLQGLLRPANWSTYAEEEWLEEDEKLRRTEAIAPTETLSLARFGVGSASAAALLAGILAALMIATHRQAAFGVDRSNAANLQTVSRFDALPAEIAQWEQVDFAERLRRNRDNISTQVLEWSYKRGLDQMILSLNFATPMPEVLAFYNSLGWRSVDAAGKSGGEASSALPNDATFNITPMQNALGAEARLLASNIGVDGEFFLPRQLGDDSGVFTSIFAKLNPVKNDVDSSLFQFQMFHQTIGRQPAVNVEMDKVFQQLRAKIAQEMSKPNRP